MIIPHDMFSYSTKSRRFTAEASDLIGYGFRNYIPRRFHIRGNKETVAFDLQEEIRDNGDGDVLLWIFRAPYGHCKDVEVHVLND